MNPPQRIVGVDSLYMQIIEERVSGYMKRYFSQQPSEEIQIGAIAIGGNQPIRIQSMLSAPSYDFQKNLDQAIRLEKAGCEILRVAIPDKESLSLIPAIKKVCSIPLVADIHYDYRLALGSIQAGVDKIRINPGNIGGEDNVKQVVTACKNRHIPIRIGVNSGSLEHHLLEEYGAPTADALVASAQYHMKMIERYDYDQIVISVKSSHVKTMIDACRLLSKQCSYPLHLGVTEAGTERMGLIKSSIGIGSLLMDGIGDTIRISLTDDPEKEITAAKDILKACGLSEGIKIISCPTCGRTRYNLLELVHQVEQATKECQKNLTIAIMGCVVNGPGEAREADLGIAGGVDSGVLFRKGQILRKVSSNEMLQALLEEIERWPGN